jgi:hypothetical protein
MEEVFLEGEDEDDDVPLGMIFPARGELRGKCWKDTRRTNDHFKMRMVAN